MDKCFHVTEALKRHMTPGTLLIVFLSFIAFGPSVWDAARGEPWINNQLEIFQTTQGAMIIEDYTFTRDTVYGLRANTIEDEEGNVICSTEHHNAWKGERNRNWQVSAFTGCEAPPFPYRICSMFSISSESGRQRQYGPFCSNLTNTSFEVEGITP